MFSLPLGKIYGDTITRNFYCTIAMSIEHKRFHTAHSNYDSNHYVANFFNGLGIISEISRPYLLFQLRPVTETLFNLF